MMNALINFVILLVILFSIQSNSSYAESQVQWIASDFYIKKVPTPLSIRSEPQDCRAQIAKVACSSSGDSKTSTCSPAKPESIRALERIYDEYPPLFQKMFCHISKISIVPDFEGTAAAGMNTDSQGHILPGGELLIRQSILDEPLTLSHWATWKEQLSFGGKTTGYQISDHLPLISSSLDQDSSGLLKFVLAHEFGHLFDFANRINRFENCREFSPDSANTSHEAGCKSQPGSWSNFSWETDRKRIAEMDFPEFSGLCFYWCKGKSLAINQVVPTYQHLFDHSNFISLYSTTNPYDDFAESLAYYFTGTFLKGSYQIDTQRGSTFDVIHEYNRDLFQAKKQFIENWISGTPLYP